MLKELGYVVVAEAFNGERAVELVREHRPDLAFLDIALPVSYTHLTLPTKA